MQERINFDALERINQQTLSLLKFWRTLNKDFRELQSQHQTLEDQYEQHRIHSEQERQQLKENHELEQEQLNQSWQEKMEHAEALYLRQKNELTERYEDEIKSLKEKIERLESIQETFMNRIRGA